MLISAIRGFGEKGQVSHLTRNFFLLSNRRGVRALPLPGVLLPHRNNDDRLDRAGFHAPR